MDEVLDKIKKIDLDLSHYEQWQMWIVGGVGLALMLMGYKIKKIAFFIAWFLLGYILTGYLVPTINSVLPDIANNAFWQNLIPILGGLLLALMGFTIEKICLAGICFGLSMMIAVQYFGTEVQVLAIGGIVGVILGGLAVTMMKPATIIATAAVGAYALTLAILALLPEMNRGIWFWPMILGFALLGTIIQFVSFKHHD
ncbi:hypothetical protein IKF23_00035 [Candidatus Saccharibacteria bacterium]|nr:hypothetical protein [Candidatus Saccharibacteria bacterium]